MITSRHYYVVHGWMISELGLKGNALIAYAIIYGFSQDGASEYMATANYLADWMGCSRSTAMEILKKLTNAGLLIKRDYELNGVKFCAYKTKPCPCPEKVQELSDFRTGVSENRTGGMSENRTGGVRKSDTINNVDKEYIKNIKYIVEFLNEKAGTRFKPTTKATMEHIRARLAEGFKLPDFEAVITFKVAQWKDDPKMAEYLRPSTLFGTKFEGYLNAARKSRQQAVGPNGIKIDQGKTDLDSFF